MFVHWNFRFAQIYDILTKFEMNKNNKNIKFN